MITFVICTTFVKRNFFLTPRVEQFEIIHFEIYVSYSKYWISLLSLVLTFISFNLTGLSKMSAVKSETLKTMYVFICQLLIYFYLIKQSSALGESFIISDYQLPRWCVLSEFSPWKDFFLKLDILRKLMPYYVLN